MPADTVVLVGVNERNDEIVEFLDNGTPVHVIGDALGTRTMGDAIEQADALARQL